MSTTITGTGVVPGVARGPALWTAPPPQLPAHQPTVAEADRVAEVERFRAAAALVSRRLSDRASAASGAAANVLGANAALAKDKGWLKAAEKRINGGQPAAQAAVDATEQFTTLFTKMGGLMAERVTDLRDIRDRVVAELLGQPEPGVPTPAQPSVLLAADLAPADTAGLDPALIVALVTELGGPTSHTSIIARQLGIPCVVAAAGIGSVASGDDLLVDGAAGTVTVGIDPAEADLLVAEDLRRREAIRAWRGPARTADGHLVQVLANVQDGQGARAAADRSQAEGIGLFRTELSFLSADHEPTVPEQQAIYSEVLAAYPQHKVVFRTLDAGSDKPLKFANLETEENPALGVRGIRLAADNPGLLTRQLDAIAAAAAETGTEPWVMAPMVAVVSEARAFAQACRARGLVPGIMVEVPAVALRAEHFLRHVDFLSIGTNDLTQYAMAADRMAPRLAALTDAWQPAVLDLIRFTAEAGRRAGKSVGVCGEAAADPLLACVLVGLGVTSLSMAHGAVAAVGAQLAAVTLEECVRAAEAVLEAEDAVSARAAARNVLLTADPLASGSHHLRSPEGNNSGSR